MKGIKIEPINEANYTLREISKMYNIPENTLNYRCRKLGVIKSVVNGHSAYSLLSCQIDDLVNYTMIAPEIIYVTRTEINYESSLRFLDLAECEKYINESKLNFK